MRKLYFINDKGMEYYFDYRTSTLFSNPTGLGVIKENTHLKFADDYLVIKKDNPVTEIGGTLVFLNNYKGYNAFLEYLKNSELLNLYYQSETLKYANVSIRSISKTEITEGALKCEIVMERLTLWRREVIFEIDIDIDLKAKIYPFIFPYTYSKFYEGKLDIINNGSVKAPLIISIEGAVNDPEILIKKGEEVISKMKLYVNYETGIIVVNSEMTSQSIKCIKNGTAEDIYQYQDFTCDNFLFIDPGNYEIEFKPGVSSGTKCKITMIEGYEGN